MNFIESYILDWQFHLIKGLKNKEQLKKISYGKVFLSLKFIYSTFPQRSWWECSIKHIY